MTNEIEGIVENVSQKTGGICIGGKWYSSTDRTKKFVLQANKGDKVKIEIDDKNAVNFIKTLQKNSNSGGNSQPMNVPEERVETNEEQRKRVVENMGNIHRDCMEKTIENLSSEKFTFMKELPIDKKSELIGQQTSTLFIQVCKALGYK